jgi:hypothetical protein
MHLEFLVESAKILEAVVKVPLRPSLAALGGTSQRSIGSR